jgi:hypothetical protein
VSSSETVPGASSTKQEVQHENDSDFDDVRFRGIFRYWPDSRANAGAA